LDFEDETFDGGYSQHVTMNIKNRKKFFLVNYKFLFIISLWGSLLPII